MRGHLAQRLPFITTLAALAAGCVGVAKNVEGDKEPEARVVILSVEGRGTRDLRRDIVRLSARRYELIPRSRYRRTARRLDAEGLTPPDVAAVSKELDLDAVVAGDLREVDGDYQLRVTVFDSEGEITEELTYELSRRKLRSRQRLALRDDLYAALDDRVARRSGPRPSRLKNVQSASDDRRRSRRQSDDDVDEDRRDRSSAERDAPESDRERRERVREESRRRSERRRSGRLANRDGEDDGEEDDERDRRDRRDRDAERERDRRSRDADRDRRDRDADRERRDRERRDAERERERERRDADRERERRRREREKEQKEQEERKPFVPRHDNSGQAIDEEVPDIL